MISHSGKLPRQENRAGILHGEKGDQVFEIFMTRKLLRA